MWFEKVGCNPFKKKLQLHVGILWHGHLATSRSAPAMPGKNSSYLPVSSPSRGSSAPTGGISCCSCLTCCTCLHLSFIKVIFQSAHENITIYCYQLAPVCDIGKISTLWSSPTSPFSSQRLAPETRCPNNIKRYLRGSQGRFSHPLTQWTMLTSMLGMGVLT